MSEAENPINEQPTSESAPSDAVYETTTPVAEEDEAPPRPPTEGVYLGTGRRKSSVARVRLIPGNPKVLVNRRELDAYFRLLQHRNDVLAPLQATNTDAAFEVHINVRGGGITGQAGAVRMGIARALASANSKYEPKLRELGFLTRDARVVERKKYGRRKARRRFQFSKR